MSLELHMINGTEPMTKKNLGLLGESGEWIATIRIYEQSIKFTCLKATKSADAQMFQDELLNLQRRSFFARYGDIFSTACRKLRKEAEACKVAGRQTLQKGYWTDVNRKLVIERPEYERVLKGGNAHEECPTHIAVSQACTGTRVGFDLGDMLPIISHYAVRNELLHANHLPMIKQGHFHDLTKVCMMICAIFQRLSRPLKPTNWIS